MRKCTLDMRITKLAVIERIDFGIQDLDFCDLLRSKFKISHRETNRSFCLSLEFQLGHSDHEVLFSNAQQSEILTK